MARGPGGHEADATGPHGRGVGPGGGTGTAKAYLKADNAIEKPTLEGKVTGPGGGVPDAKGTKGYGMGAGPGGGKETGSGLDFQREIEDLHIEYPGKMNTIYSYIKDYYTEATELELNGTSRWDYVLNKVKEKLRKEKASNPSQGTQQNNTTNENTPQNTLDNMVLGDNFYNIGAMVANYSDAKTTEQKQTVAQVTRQYLREAHGKNLTGQAAEKYAANKLKQNGYSKINANSKAKVTAKKAA